MLGPLGYSWAIWSPRDSMRNLSQRNPRSNVALLIPTPILEQTKRFRVKGFTGFIVYAESEYNSYAQKPCRWRSSGLEL